MNHLSGRDKYKDKYYVYYIKEKERIWNKFVKEKLVNGVGRPLFCANVKGSKSFLRKIPTRCCLRNSKILTKTVELSEMRF